MESRHLGDSQKEYFPLNVLAGVSSCLLRSIPSWEWICFLQHTDNILHYIVGTRKRLGLKQCCTYRVHFRSGGQLCKILDWNDKPGTLFLIISSWMCIAFHILCNRSIRLSGNYCTWIGLVLCCLGMPFFIITSVSKLALRNL